MFLLNELSVHQSVCKSNHIDEQKKREELLVYVDYNWITVVIAMYFLRKLPVLQKCLILQ